MERWTFTQLMTTLELWPMAWPQTTISRIFLGKKIWQAVFVDLPRNRSLKIEMSRVFLIPLAIFQNVVDLQSMSHWYREVSSSLSWERCHDVTVTKATMTLKTFLMTFQTRFKFPASIYLTKRSQCLCQFLEAGGVVEILRYDCHGWEENWRLGNQNF